MVPFAAAAESCPLVMFPLLLLVALLLLLLLLLLLSLASVSACLSAALTAAAAAVLVLLFGVTGAETKSKKSPLCMSSGRNVDSPMSMALIGEVFDAVAVLVPDDIAVVRTR